MVKVYAEDLKHISAELWAVFETEALYEVCMDALDAEAEKNRMIITTSVEEYDEEQDVKDFLGATIKDIF